MNRPTREQVDYELARVDDEYVCSDDRHRLLVAEIRALRDGWADLPTPEDVAAEMSRQEVGSDTQARRDSLTWTACRALDAIGTLRERGVRRTPQQPGELPSDDDSPCCIAAVTSGGRDHIPGCHA